MMSFLCFFSMNNNILKSEKQHYFLNANQKFTQKIICRFCTSNIIHEFVICYVFNANLI